MGQSVWVRSLPARASFKALLASYPSERMTFWPVSVSDGDVRALTPAESTLHLLGEQDRIIGISSYVVRPPRARQEKPRVSAFTSANIYKILALKPDLMLIFSDLQAGVAADLIRRGFNVHAFNHRSVAGILDMTRIIGAMVKARERAEQLVARLEAGLVQARSRSECLPKRPKAFFESGTIR